MNIFDKSNIYALGIRLISKNGAQRFIGLYKLENMLKS